MQARNPCQLFFLQKAWHAQFLRKEAHYKYDSPGSRLTHVLGKLLYEARLEEEQLRGLNQHQLNAIRWYKDFMSEADATEPGT
jgi:hypothetical protein